MNLTDLLDAYVLPAEGEDILGTCHRADVGARLVGGLVVAAVAALPPPGPPALLSKWLKRPSTGAWAQATRLALSFLDRRAHPLGPWAGLRQHEGADERAIDRWLTEYETSLRHSGRVPLPSQVAGLHRALSDGLRRLCARLVDGCVSPLALAGTGRATRMVVGAVAVPTAPFVELAGDELWLWDGQAGNKEGCSWNAVRVVAGRLAIRRVEDRATPWRTIGAAAALADQPRAEPLAPFAAKTVADVPRPDLDGRPTAYLVTSGDAFAAAEALASSWRTPARPVVVLGGGTGDDLDDRLAEMLFDDKGSPADALAQWSRGPGHEPAILLVAGAALDPRAVAIFAEPLAAVATIVVVTPAHTFDHRWSPKTREGFRVRRDQSQADAPEAVEARLRCGLDAVAAWSEGARDVFGIVDAASLRRCVDAMQGRLGLLEAEDCMSWWIGGAVAVAPDGQLRPGHAGWDALLAGLLGGPAPADHAAAWQAGRALAAAVRSHP